MRFDRNIPGINIRGTLKPLLKLILIIVIVLSIGYLIENNAYIHGMFSPVDLLIEFFFVFVSLSIFTMTWFAYSKSHNDHTLFMGATFLIIGVFEPVSYTHLRAHETRHDLVCRLLLDKKKIS